MSMERDSLLREVDDELQRERLEKLWQQYGTYLIGAVAALLLGIGFYKWWDGRRIAASELTGQRYEAALDLLKGGKAEEAQAALSALAANASASYPVLAQLALAGQSAKAGKTDAAIAAYDAAALKASDPLLKDFARLQSTALKIDSADFTEVQNRLNDLIGEKSPWRYLAREQLGVAAMRAGRLDEARNILGPLSADPNPRLPASIRERAGALMALVVAIDQEKSMPGKIEFEKTDTPAVTPADPASAKTEPVRPKGAPARGVAPPRTK
jgi:hypothetical protein